MSIVSFSCWFWGLGVGAIINGLPLVQGSNSQALGNLSFSISNTREKKVGRGDLIWMKQFLFSQIL
jgi:hypothetical protein